MLYKQLFAVASILPLIAGAKHQRRANSTSTNATLAAEGILSNGLVDLGDWADAYAQAEAFVAGLTNSEKISIITGGDVASANWTALQFKDGGQGPQGYDWTTGWGESSALGMTWDKAAIGRQFSAIALEFYQKGFQVANAPTSQPLGRTPWGGRLVEALGADPYLNGIAFGLGAKAFSDVGVIPGGKHFLLNEQETNRSASGGMGGGGGFGGGSPPGAGNMTLAARDTTTTESAPYSSNADDKTIHETYLWTFYDAVKNGLGGVMCAMTKVNGTLSCENADLLNTLLKTELGFPGLVFPDVNGQSSAYGSADAGLDYGSSNYWSNDTLGVGIANGSFSQARLDDMVIRNSIGYFKVNLNNGSQPALAGSSDFVDTMGNHSVIVRENGAASLVLLKNTNNALPLNKPRSMALFGSGAGPVMAGPNYVFDVTGAPSTYDGHLAGGSGSGQTSFPYLYTPNSVLTQRAAADHTMIRWILNNTYTTSSSSTLNGLSGGTAISQSVTSYATSAEVCLVFINAFSGEGADRTELKNDEQDALVNSVAAECNNTMVVINTVGARLVDQWIENDNITAVVYGGLLGQESGNSIADVLYGDVNPSGRLPYTIAKNESDYNVEICYTYNCNFTEGNYIDYKYFDKYNVTPRYEFGYGLSYTEFTYGNLTVNTNTTALSSIYPTGILTVGGKADLWDEVMTVTLSISNTGSVDGNEVAQLYVTYPDVADQPLRQLRGFEKVLIATGAQESVTFSLRRRDLSYWDVVAQEWAIARGTYTFSVGASSRDLRVFGTATVS
ncbi:beta-glucosidase D [Coleophoma crateriformis]|uniref:beta-glucosidase n=1 Tax=Coleophoma crateriformis TaxID=565419 RepID=A0A3D8RVC2_9HELO|nr:beta-glucosidase D [Coleophoma crateriformis]